MPTARRNECNEISSKRHPTLCPFTFEIFFTYFVERSNILFSKSKVKGAYARAFSGWLGAFFSKCALIFSTSKAGHFFEFFENPLANPLSMDITFRQIGNPSDALSNFSNFSKKVRIFIMICQRIAGYAARGKSSRFRQHHWSKNCHKYQRHCSHILASLLTDFCDKFCEKLSRNFLGFCMRTLCTVNAKSVKKYSCKCSACRDNFQLYFYHNFEQIFPIFLLKMRTLCAVNFKQKTGFYYCLFPVKTCSNFEQDFIKK